MLASKVLPTWGGGEERFEYTGSVAGGTTIRYGEAFKWTATISAAHYKSILQKFGGKEIRIGTSKDKPPAGSVGEWVKEHINRSGLMSYVGAVLVEEGFAVKPKRGWIRFHRLT